MSKKYGKITDLIDSLVDNISNEAYAVNENIIAEVLSKLDSLTISDGYLQVDSKLFETVSYLDKKIGALLKKSKYSKVVNELLNNFDTITNDIVSFHEDFNKIDTKGKLKSFSTLKKLAIEQTYDNLLGTGIDYKYTKPIKDLLILSASSNQSLSNTKKLFEKMVDSGVTFGTVKTENLKSYATQISRDYTYGYQGQVNKTIADEFEMNGFIYVGGAIKDTRPICLKLVSKEKILFSELPKILNSTDKDGMIPNTNKDNFLIYRGGYNCRHEAIPTIIE